MAQDDVIKLPRIYVEDDLEGGGVIGLGREQAHYLLHVLRLRAGDEVRMFNGRDGGWHGVIDSADKKQVSIRIENKLKDQPPQPREVHLYFAPIKKARMDWMIEKAVELGATHLHPVLTQNTEVRAINEDRVRAQIVEAAEQCERLDVPELFPLQPLFSCLPPELPLLACVERIDAKSLDETALTKEPVAFLIGPEGGFTAEEKSRLCGMKNVRPVSLGPRILRSETAAVVVLCAVNL